MAGLVPVIGVLGMAKFSPDERSRSDSCIEIDQNCRIWGGEA